MNGCIINANRKESEESANSLHFPQTTKLTMKLTMMVSSIAKPRIKQNLPSRVVILSPKLEVGSSKKRNEGSVKRPRRGGRKNLMLRRKSKTP